MCKEMLVIPVNKVVDPKRIIGKNGGPRRTRDTRGRCTPKNMKKCFDYETTQLSSNLKRVEIPQVHLVTA
jgi:hypothetical protein